MAFAISVKIFAVLVGVFVIIAIWDYFSPNICPRCYGTGFDQRDGMECLNCNML